MTIDKINHNSRNQELLETILASPELTINKFDALVDGITEKNNDPYLQKQLSLIDNALIAGEISVLRAIVCAHVAGINYDLGADEQINII